MLTYFQVKITTTYLLNHINDIMSLYIDISIYHYISWDTNNTNQKSLSELGFHICFGLYSYSNE